MNTYPYHTVESSILCSVKAMHAYIAPPLDIEHQTIISPHLVPGERTKKGNLHTYCTYSYTHIFIAIINRKHIYFCTNNAHLINIALFSPNNVKVTLLGQKYLSLGLISNSRLDWRVYFVIKTENFTTTQTF